MDAAMDTAWTGAWAAAKDAAREAKHKEYSLKLEAFIRARLELQQVA
jgi:hypothetical protein